jgi:hypothetical protein
MGVGGDALGDAPGAAAARARALAERSAGGLVARRLGLGLWGDTAYPSAPFFFEIPISTSEAYSYLRIFF